MHLVHGLSYEIACHMRSTTVDASMIHFAPLPGALLVSLGGTSIIDGGGGSGGAGSSCGCGAVLGLRRVLGSLVLGMAVAIAFHVWRPTSIPSGLCQLQVSHWIVWLRNEHVVRGQSSTSRRLSAGVRYDLLRNFPRLKLLFWVVWFGRKKMGTKSMSNITGSAKARQGKLRKFVVGSDEAD